MTVKKYLLGSAALLLLVGVASAADLPLKAMAVKAPPPLVYDWTGFYVGGYYGDALGNQKGGTPPQRPAATAARPTSTSAASRSA
jgi:outer membrane immunogenic protein